MQLSPLRMKKILLLIISGIFALSAFAQQRIPSIVVNRTIQQKAAARNHGTRVKSNQLGARFANKTTSPGTGGAWYDYAGTISGAGSSLDTGLFALYMWQDTAAIFADVPDTNYMGYGIPNSSYYYPTSLGVLFNPMDSAWVPSGNFIPPSSGYTIDSVTIKGIYGRPIGATYTDSIKLTFVYGDGSSTSNMPFSYFNDATLLGWVDAPGGDTSLYFPYMYWDTLLNTATSIPAGIAPISYTFPLIATDTSVANLFVRTYPVNIVVPDSNFTGMSISFISGATSFPSFPVKDTIRYTDGSFKYGCFMPVVAAIHDTGTWLYPPVTGVTSPTIKITDDFAPGYFKIEGTYDFLDSIYLPDWFSPSIGSTPLQTPDVLFHAYKVGHLETPAANNMANEVTAYPNPANNKVTISYRLTSTADVTVSLTDMLGQIVNEQRINSVSGGKVVINTAGLSQGVYFYTITANGQRNTGRVVVVH